MKKKKTNMIDLEIDPNDKIIIKDELCEHELKWYSLNNHECDYRMCKKCKKIWL